MPTDTERLPMEFSYEYRVFRPYGDWKHMWIVRGVHGAIHFHCDNPDAEHVLKYGPSAGLEIHYRTPPLHMMRAPSQDRCWILKAPCWHDGTSLHATETLYPLIDWRHPLEFFRMLVLEMKRFDDAAMREEGDDG